MDCNPIVNQLDNTGGIFKTCPCDVVLQTETFSLVLKGIGTVVDALAGDRVVCFGFCMHLNGLVLVGRMGNHCTSSSRSSSRGKGNNQGGGAEK